MTRFFQSLIPGRPGRSADSELPLGHYLFYNTRLDPVLYLRLRILMPSVISCPSCGKEWPSDLDLKYCGECGADLTSSRPETVVKERRTLNVLFADISGFTGFTEGKDPEAVKETLDQMFSRLGEIVDNYGGYVDKYLGDGIMAIFGAPEAHEDDPLRAVRVGLEMIEEMKSFRNQPLDENQRPDREGGVSKHHEDTNLSLRVGINRGEVVWSKVGGGDYTATGDAVNVAKRLETETDPDTVMVSHSIQKHTRDRIRYRQLNPIQLKGREGMVQPYLAEEQKEHLGPLKETAGVTASMVGRDAEFRRIVDRFEGDGPSFLAVTGKAGIGKSRLLREFEEYLVEYDTVVVLGRGSASPHSDVLREPMGNLLLAKADTGRADPDAGEKVVEKIIADFAGSKYDKTKRENFAHLMALSVGLELPETRVKEMPAKRKREETHLAWSHWISERQEDQSLVLMFEDLHWSGPPTLQLLEHLVTHFRDESNERTDLTVLTSLRPEGEVPDGFERMELTELSREACRRIAEEVLGKPITDEFESFLAKETAGNPYFVEEMIRYLLEGERITETSNGYDLTEEDKEEGEEVPDTLNGLLVGRIDRLPEEEKETLKTASVAGRRFWMHLLEEALDREARQEVEALSGREMVFRSEESEIPGDLQYIFKHALLRDSAYGLLTKKARAKLHSVYSLKLEQIARAQNSSQPPKEGRSHDRNGAASPPPPPEEKNSDKPTEPLPDGRDNESRPTVNRSILALAARHAHEAGEEERAGELWIEAGKTALEEDQYEESLSMTGPARETPYHREARLLAAKAHRKLARFDRAMEELRNVTGEEMTDNQDTRRRILEAEVHLAKAKPTKAREVLGNLDTAALRNSEQMRAKQIKASTLRRLGEYEKSLKEYEKLLQLAEREGNQKKKADVLNGIGVIKLNLGKHKQAMERFDSALQISREIGDLRGRSVCLNNIGLANLNLEEFGRAKENFEDALQIKRDIGDRRGEALALNNLGIVHNDQFECKKALDHYEKSLSILRQIGDQNGEASCLNNMGNIFRKLGSYEKAKEQFESSLNIRRTIEGQHKLTSLLNNYAQLNKEIGQYGKALQQLTKSEEISRKVGARAKLISSLTGRVNTLIETILAKDAIANQEEETYDNSREKIEAILSEATDVAGDLKSPVNLTQVLLPSARHHLINGEKQEAENKLQEARTIIEEERDPEKHWEYLRTKAELAREAGDSDRADRAAGKIIKRAKANDLQPWIARGHYLAGDYNKARDIAGEIGFHSLLFRMQNERVLDPDPS